MTVSRSHRGSAQAPAGCSTYDAAVVVLGNGQVGSLLVTLESIAAVLEELPQMRIRLVIAELGEVLAQLPLEEAEDLVVVPVEATDDVSTLATAVRVACADHHVVLRVGTRATSSHAAFLAAKAGAVPRSAQGALRPGESLGGRFESLGLSLAGQVELDDATVLEGPVCLYRGMVNFRPTHIGAFTYSSSLLTGAVVSVGRYCSIAHDVEFGAAEHPTQYLSTSPFQYNGGGQWEGHLSRAGSSFCARSRELDEKHPAIRIGNDVWIGAGAYIKGGVTLGDGCIVGSRAVVTRDVPPFAVVVGSPGRVVRYRFEPHVVDRLLELAWWQYDCADFGGVDVADVERSIDHLVQLRDSGLLKPYRGFQQPFSELVQQLGV